MDVYKSKKSHEDSSKHKHKKKKHHKKKKTRSSSSGSEGSEMEWVEAPSSEAVADKTNIENKREDWMHEEMFVSTLSKDDLRSSSSSRQRKLEAQIQKREKEEAIQKDRELNPHWKNNGTGLPEKPPTADNLALPSTSVGDGGYSYLKKAYYRIQEQSQQEGRSMEEIAVERWGSLEKLISMISEAEDRMKQNSKTRYSSGKYKWNDRHEKRSSDRFQKPSKDKYSPSNSPERSFKYEKPKHVSKKDRKVGHFSSTVRRRDRNARPDYLNDESNSDSSCSRTFTKKHSDSRERTSDFIDCDKRNIPAWKKPKTLDDRKELAEKRSPQDIFVWDKPSSFLNQKTAHGNRSSKTVPNWKKSKYSDEKESSYSVCESPKSRSSEDEAAQQVERAPKTDFPEILSEDDLNKLAAKCTKAELMGNAALAKKLKSQLEEARELLKSGGSMQSAGRDKERIRLTKMDSSGQERPIHYSDDIHESQTKQRKKQSQKFFDDGSRYSLKQMFEREKLTTIDDNIEMFMEVAKECKEADDENETSGISKKATNKMANHLQEEKDVGRAIHQYQKSQAALKNCNYCLDQPNMKRHLLVNKRNQIYLCIPDFQSLVEGHCLIVPKRHVSSFLALDEEEWSEVEDMKLCLRNMFRKQNKNIIILETSRSFKYYPHAFLEVIPVPEEISDMAPLYFKKAILESEEEWANNVKLIDLTKKGLRRSVPKNLPYFCVQFDPKIHSGYAHVIEDEKNFERNFGKEVIGGMLDIDYNYLFKNRKEDPTKKSKETLQFIKIWENFNENSD